MTRILGRPSHPCCAPSSEVIDSDEFQAHRQATLRCYPDGLMIIRSVERRAPAHFYWLIQVALLLMLIAAMLIAAAALGSPHVIRSLLEIGRESGTAPLPRDKPGVELCTLRRPLAKDVAGPSARPAGLVVSPRSTWQGQA